MKSANLFIIINFFKNTFCLVILPQYIEIELNACVWARSAVNLRVFTCQWGERHFLTTGPQVLALIVLASALFLTKYNPLNQIPPLYTSAPIYIQMTHELIWNLRDLEKSISWNSICMPFAWYNLWALRLKNIKEPLACVRQDKCVKARIMAKTCKEVFNGVETLTPSLNSTRRHLFKCRIASL